MEVYSKGLREYDRWPYSPIFFIGRNKLDTVIIILSNPRLKTLNRHGAERNMTMQRSMWLCVLTGYSHFSLVFFVVGATRSSRLVTLQTQSLFQILRRLRAWTKGRRQDAWRAGLCRRRRSDFSERLRARSCNLKHHHYGIILPALRTPLSLLSCPA